MRKRFVGLGRGGKVARPNPRQSADVGDYQTARSFTWQNDLPEFCLAMPLCIDLPGTSQDQLLSQREELGPIALGIFLAADVGVIAGCG